MITSYKDLPIGKYIEIQDAMREADEMERTLRTFAALTGMTHAELLALPLMEFRAIAEASKFLETEAMPEVKIGQLYRLGEWVLIPTTDIRKMSIAQYIDFQDLAKGGEKMLPALLSTLLVPKGCKYMQGYDIDELQRDIAEKMNVPTCIALSAFFLRRLQRSIRSMLICCKWMIRANKRKIDEMERGKMMVEIMRAEHLLKNGAGCDAWMPSARRAAVNGTRRGK